MRCLIAVPTFENIQPETFKSIYGLDIPEDFECDFTFIRGYDCAIARNKVAKAALEYDYLLSIDSDMMIPEDALRKLYEAGFDICFGVYPRSTGDGTNIIKPSMRDFVDSYFFAELDKLSGPISVKAGGFGCALIKTTVFQRVPFPWFKYVAYNDGRTLSEDYYFCKQAGMYDFSLGVEPTVRCGHIIRTFQYE